MNLNQELKIRGFSKKTILAYTYYNKTFLKFSKKPPLKITNQDIKNYIEHLIDKGYSSSTVRLAFNALRFYYCQVLGRRLTKKMKLPKREQKLVGYLNKPSIIQIINSLNNPKHRLLVMLMYSSGLRVSEAVKIRVRDIHDKAVIVRNGKGKKDRLTLVSKTFLKEFKNHGKNLQPSNYLFTGSKGNHLSVRTAQQILRQVSLKTSIPVHPHKLRHSFATHLVEDKVPLPAIQSVLGHQNIKTTQKYLHANRKKLCELKSPLDH